MQVECLVAMELAEKSRNVQARCTSEPEGSAIGWTA